MKLPFKKVLGATALLLFAGILILTAVYLKSVADYQNAVRETAFSDIDISDIPDGIYVGEYDVNFVYARVQVTVQNGVITGIDILEHKNGRGEPAEIITERIIAEQKIG